MQAKEKYFRFLLSLVKGDYKLCKTLFSLEFRWDYTIELDADRAENGKGLRVLYFQETGESAGMDGEPCNVFEMLVAMCLAMENIMGEPGNDHPDRWFNDMMENLDILDKDTAEVQEKVCKWMMRDYDKNGVGGIFPISKPYRDQRKVPIWEQAGEYMSERLLDE